MLFQAKMEMVVVSFVASRPHSGGGLFQLHVEWTHASHGRPS
jgi:hypothetical protein